MNDIKDEEDIDAIYEQYKDFDFSHAKPVAEIPFLREFQARRRAEPEKIGIRPALLQRLRQKAEQRGEDYRRLAEIAIEEYLATH
ncbi:hypothetical protein [uncultured Cardiobacterium sp.]|uniref:hypothetical protein n=1 Tax=uncultured Cardiobacterium sp. TaxID=417619 RepID=UPI0026207A48|nr:hypothetical protein [uncultured Cardiobacterium sp.]